MKQVTFPGGRRVGALGQGTWHMGEHKDRHDEEVAAIRLGIELGLTLIDTAEMYGEGRAEMLVGEAIKGQRDEVFIVTKVYPHHASRIEMHRACNNSLQRLNVEAIDLYLLHWPGEVPLDETVGAFEALQREGKIRHWGVSNVDLTLMKALWQLPGGAAAQTDQVLYNLATRGIEWDLLPWLREHRLPVMAYSPFDEGRLLRQRGLVACEAACDDAVAGGARVAAGPGRRDRDSQVGPSRACARERRGAGASSDGGSPA
jgi:diketogulonate reductase-like aldo/keto reductase